MGIKNSMRKLFIHAVCRAYKVTAHKGYLRHFKQALNSSVLAVFAVKNRENTIDLDVTYIAVLAHCQKALIDRVGAEHTGYVVRVLYPRACGDIINISDILQPMTFFCDTHAHNVVSVLWNAPYDV